MVRRARILLCLGGVTGPAGPTAGQAAPPGPPGPPPPRDPGFRTDGNLHGAADAPAGAPQAHLDLPDFTARSGAGRRDTWTATPNGIAQFHHDNAITPLPWTWSPIAGPTGRGIHAVEVTEIVFCAAGRPTDQWRSVNAGPVAAATAGGGTPACAHR